MYWPIATPLDTVRLALEPVSPRHAHEMVAALASLELYTFTGGEPPTEASLRARYVRQSIGHSPAGDAGWLNWIIRSRETRDVVGYVQSTLTMEEGTLAADIAWLIAPPAQHAGIATEAATAMLAWLHQHQVFAVGALIHPEHRASAGVAQRLGLVTTGVLMGDESVWELRTDARAADQKAAR